MSPNQSRRKIAVSLGCILLACSAPEIHAQLCDPADITLSTQTMVDNFQRDHGPCDLVGSLTVSGPDIANLQGLRELVASNGNVTIRNNPELPTLEGLESFVSVGGSLELTDNASLARLSGVTALEYVGQRLRIARNAQLEHLFGLSALRTVRSFVVIEQNGSLADLQGLGSLEEALTFNVVGNARLQSLRGVDSLNGHNLILRIFDNPELRNLEGLEHIAELRGLFLQGGSLDDLDGLSGLRAIDWEFIIQLSGSLRSLDGLDVLERVGTVWFVGNAALTNVDALHRVSQLDDLIIRSNPSLLHLDGLSALVGVAGDVKILDNASLGSCGALATVLDRVDDADAGPGPPGLPDVGGDALVGDNAPGCNCILQVLEPGSGMFVLNPALTDAWFNPLQDGQGFFINVFSDLETMFVGWFTFETADRGPDEAWAIIGEPYHRWLTATGGWAGIKARLDVTLTAGGVFDSGEGVANSPPDGYGNLTIIFHSCDSATLSYELYGIANGAIPLVRLADDNVARCRSWSDYY